MMTDSRPIPELPAILASIWATLEASCDRVAVPWSRSVVSNVSRTGPEARTLILRRVSPANRDLVAFTDGRSSKVDELRADGRSVWTFYDPERREQLVAHAHIEVLTTGEFADECWQGSRPESLRCYLGPQAPGVVTPEAGSNMPLDLTPGVASHAELQAGRRNFAVLRGVVHTFDWLELHPQGNLRARFTWQEMEWRHDWVTP